MDDIDADEGSNGHRDHTRASVDHELTQLAELELESHLPLPEGLLDSLTIDADAVGGPWSEPEAYRGSVGRTMFDTPTSEDGHITVLVPRENMESLPAQSLVSIISQPDKREYRGVVVKGPFSEPDGLRGDTPIMVTTAVKGGIFMPQFHGRTEVELLHQVVNGRPVPPRFRPLPNSPVFSLGLEETAAILKVAGDIRLGLAIGYEDLAVSIPSESKAALPRHIGYIGTTGGGKSTTVSGMIDNFQRADMATVLIDTEGEYTAIDQPTDDPIMVSALELQGRRPSGVANTHLYYLVTRETMNPLHQSQTAFSLEFSSLSPYMASEILRLNEAQQTRFLKAYDITKRLLRQFKISPNAAELDGFLEPDEMERGYPRMRLAHIYDVVRACAAKVGKDHSDPYFNSPEFLSRKQDVLRAVNESEGLDNIGSWRALQGKIGNLFRLGIFDSSEANPLNYSELITPGRVSIIDLSDTDSTEINNLVIAEVLRGVAKQQDEAYKSATKDGSPLPRTMILIEEAHEFLSANRIKQMEAVFQQVARIARRGRKRWLGLGFITQLPQHLPDEVLGLINSFVLHKLADANVISRLKRSIGGLDDGQWRRLPNLAPGQAIVTTPTMTRPLLVSIDPTPCKLLMIE
jgi:uncharacterized protein